MEKKRKGYRHRLVEALGSMDFPAVGVGRVAICHDKGCGIWSTGQCTCTPDISIPHGEDVAVVGEDGSVSERVRRS
jgi:hypothetical protein